jgi:hypothetical protein
VISLRGVALASIPHSTRHECVHAHDDEQVHGTLCRCASSTVQRFEQLKHATSRVPRVSVANGQASWM